MKRIALILALALLTGLLSAATAEEFFILPEDEAPELVSELPEPEVGEADAPLSPDPGVSEAAPVANAAFEAPARNAEGSKCGPGLSWALKDSTLAITGVGPMYDYSATAAPWADRASEITALSLPVALTAIGDGAFAGLDKLAAVSIPVAVTVIGSRAFDGCASLNTITFTGNAPIVIRDAAFNGVSASAYYPAGNVTWTAAARKDYGGKLLWQSQVRSLSEAKVTVLDQVYTGAALPAVPIVTMTENAMPTLLVPGLHYTVVYSDNINVGTATATIRGLPSGGYTGTVKATFRILPANIGVASVQLEDQTYAGKALKPAPVVKLLGRTLKKGADYTVAYADNTTAGKATVTVTGVGNYTGTAKGEFTIKPVDLTGVKVTVAAQTYTGKALKPAPVVKLTGVTLKKGRDYTVAYADNKQIGAATVTVTGIGSCTGAKEATFKILPKGTTVSKLTGGKKQITVQWKKQATQTKGYQIQYGVNADFTGAKTRKISKTGTTRATIKSLKAKTAYYVRIRTWTKANDKTYYSAWSAAKKVKTK